MWNSIQAATVLFWFAALLNLLGSNADEQWTGKYFPGKQIATEAPSDNETEEVPPELRDAKHGVKMGVSSKSCDDAESFIEHDYNGSSIVYTCMQDKHLFLPNSSVNPLFEKENMPKGYRASHHCINHSITYDRPVPTFGPHRPLWAHYGEYLYCPPQRYLHNLEHGAIVMLYHPCANGNEVLALKNLVTNCLYRHIITPSLDLTPERPLALVSWGYKLLLPRFDKDLALKFILERFNKGYERTSKNGKYSYALISEATYLTDRYDSHVCIKVTKV